MALGIDWPDIRLRYMRGETPYRISKSLGGKPTRQWIWRKARRERWDEGLPGLVARRHLEPPQRSPTKDTPARRARIIEILSNGGTYKLAAASVAIHENTLADWRKSDPEFGGLCQAAMASFALAQLGKVANSSDTRDARFLLQHNPLTRQDFQDHRGRDPKVEVVINIPRSEAEVASMGYISASAEIVD